MDAIGLKQAPVTGTDFSGSMTVPPIGGQAIGAVPLRRGIDGNVIRTFELDDMRCQPGNAGIAPTLGIGNELEIHLDAGVVKGIKVADFSSDGSEVRHGWFGGWS